MLMAVSVPGVALGDDLNPPTYRFFPNSTFTEWNGLFIVPFFLSVDDGFPLAGSGVPTVQMNPVAGGSDWSFFQPNFVDNLAMKKLRIQVTYSQAGPFGPAITGVTGVKGAGPGVPATDVSGLLSIPMAVPGRPGFRYFARDFEFFPNPDFETIDMTVPFGVTIDQVVIDSISIPEPGSLVMLTAGGLMLARRMR